MVSFRLAGRWLHALLALSSLALACTHAGAAEWPERAIRLVVCFPPGNAADVLARSIEPLLSQRLGQPVVVENKGGAGGSIGVDSVLKAAPDGYTIGVCSLSPLTIMPATRRKMPYDVERDLAPILWTYKGPMIAVVRKDSPFNTLQDLVKYSKANPGKLTYASLGPGTISQMSTEAFRAASGASLTEVSYKGSSQALTDLLGGHVDFMLDGAASAAVQIASGNVKALAVTTNRRSPLVPNVITMEESGIPGLKGFNIFGWVSFFAPAAVPPAVVARLNREIAQILKDPQVIKRAEAAGQDVSETSTPEQFRDFLRSDLARWSSIARQFNIEVKD